MCVNVACRHLFERVCAGMNVLPGNSKVKAQSVWSILTLCVCGWVCLCVYSMCVQALSHMYVCICVTDYIRILCKRSWDFSHCGAALQKVCSLCLWTFCQCLFFSTCVIQTLTFANFSCSFFVCLFIVFGPQTTYTTHKTLGIFSFKVIFMEKIKSSCYSDFISFK